MIVFSRVRHIKFQGKPAIDLCGEGMAAFDKLDMLLIILHLQQILKELLSPLVKIGWSILLSVL